ncbi:putative C2H2-type domain-containing protein [Phytophthora infestans]|uniref:Putative C2H2-type domain-containing protein n=1 Tax=Phytophthora infestans TaxID=4787 RepID=A0A8S9TNP1_PHYIN|nr:putative C2H2-type domain-containing protein [Phytophthora infestans]
MEQVRELPSGKCVRKYSPEHPLFDTGTRLWAAKYYQELGSMMQPEEAVGGPAHSEPITCRLAKCNVSFQSTSAYEEHYDMMHRNICRECSRSFLSLRLLDIHISETHDAFFKILSKKKPMYVCLVDGCPETFQHDDKRTKHLIRVHQYPGTFSFHQQRKQKVKLSKGSAGLKHEDGNEQSEVDAETIKKREARKRRRQQKKKKLLEQLKLPNSDMQVDEGLQKQEGHKQNTPSEITDVDMADLEEDMRELRIPKSIHFGRKRRI